MNRKKNNRSDEIGDVSADLDKLSLKSETSPKGTAISTDRSVDPTYTSVRKKIDFNRCVPSTSAQRRDEKKDDILLDGEWLKDHPWKDKSPNRGDEMAPTISKAAKYTLTETWLQGDKVDLAKIYGNLPQFIGEMKGPSSREDMKYLLNLPMYEALTLNPTRPHILEIVQEGKKVKPKDKPSPYKNGEKLKAFSSGYCEEPSQAKYYHFDCEYMLNMYLPDSFNAWFNIDDGKRIRSVTPDENRRWIFTPSFSRAEIALMKWPKDDTITPESTIRILVVRPFEFDKYVRNHGHTFPVISLPQDEIGAGYPRFWIQKMALRLKLHFIWMIDDSIECFYEYHPKKKPESTYRKDRRRPFGSVFKRIERLVKEAQTGENPIAAMSPKNFMGGTVVNNAFVCSPPRMTVFLNLRLLKEKEVYYRPELQAFEDMVFGYECEKNGLKVFINNRIHQQDHRWKDTGAQSPSVTQHQTHQTKAVPDPDSDTDSDISNDADADCENDSD